MSDQKPVRRHTFYCSFCGVADYQARRLVAGPTVFICDECVWIATDTLAKSGVVRPEPVPETEPPA